MFNSATLATIFAPTSGPLEPLDTDVEVALIEAAKGGDASAWEALMQAYRPALRNALTRRVASLRDSGIPVDYDELRSDAYMAVVEAVHAVAPGKELATVITHKLNETLNGGDAKGSVTLSVPPRTRRRFFEVMRAAKGDIAEAERIAPSHDLAVDTFHAVLAATRTDSVDALLEAEYGGEGAIVDDADDFASAEDRILAGIALSACDEDERAVLRLAYGFESYDEPLIDYEVAERLSASRSRVQRLRAAGLAKGRVALGA